MLYLTTLRGALYQDDCMNILPFMQNDVVDCIFADPPFNLGKDYKNGYDDNQQREIFIEWSHQWIKECSRILKPGGAFFLYATPELNIIFGNFLNKYLNFRHWIACSMKGTYKRGNRLYPAHYSLLYYTKGDPKTFNDLRTPIPVCRHCGGEIPDYGGHRDKINPEGLNLTDIWTDTSPNRHKKFKVREGVNELKITIPERAILISTKEDDLVLDPFGGGGSTYQAAQRLNRRWIGIELYDCMHIRKRLQEDFALYMDIEPDFDINNLFIPTYENHRN